MSRDKFNLDFEESLLLRARLGKLKKIMKFIHEKTRYLLNKKNTLSEHEKDVLKDIRDVSKIDRTEDE